MSTARTSVYLVSVLTIPFPVGSAFRSFLSEVSSYGALVIATGPIFVDPETYVAKHFDPNNLDENPEALTVAIDWVHANAGKGNWKHIDASRIGVWGQSCGGLEAYSAGANDSRVSHLGIFNSGQLNESDSARVAGALRKPVFYLLGGPTDVAYPNGELDYANLPHRTPAWKGNHQLGHSVAFDVPNAGIPGIAGRHIMQWMLRGDARAKRWFVGDGPSEIGVDDVEYKSLKGIRVTPIQK
jgi:hypothetical protein